MKNVVVAAFTSRGFGLAKRAAEALNKAGYSAGAHRVSDLREFVPPVFIKGNILVFVGAAGIAVRAVAPLAADKTKDPAVIVMDELGRYVIPLLSGHIGGANRFAEELARLINAVPIITTATDINGVFSVDGFAAEKGYAIVNPECIKDISAALLEGKEVCLRTDFEIDGAIPEGLVLKDSGKLGISIGAEENRRPFAKTLALMPKYVHAGIGAKRNVPFDALRDFFFETLAEEKLPAACVGTISSIDLKRNEEAIVRLAALCGVSFITYTPERLREYESMFEQSEFVKKTTGAGNVCEVSAWLSSKKGEVVCKRVKNGMTLALAKESWRVDFGITDGGN